MASILKVDTIQDQSGNNIINENANTVTIGKSGDTVNVIGTLQNGGTNFLQGITEADQWRLTADITTNTSPISANLERVDNTGFGKIGTGMSVSSGIFTFPSTGLYKVSFTINAYTGVADTLSGNINVTLDNSTYSTFAQVNSGDSGSGRLNSHSASTFVNVTNTSNVKVYFSVSSVATGSGLIGNTDINKTFMEFIRLGDSV